MPEQPSSEITPDDRLWAALGYPLVIIAVISMLMDDKKNRPFIRYHAIQAMLFNVAVFAVASLLAISAIGALCAPFVWVATLWPAFDAYRGSWTELPFITSFIKNQGWV